MDSFSLWLSTHLAVSHTQPLISLIPKVGTLTRSLERGTQPLFRRGTLGFLEDVRGILRQKISIMVIIINSHTKVKARIFTVLSIQP